MLFQIRQWNHSLIWYGSLFRPCHSTQYLHRPWLFNNLFEFDNFPQLLERQLVLHDAAFINVLIFILIDPLIHKFDSVVVGVHALYVDPLLGMVDVVLLDLVDGVGIDA